jgi:hypothetical protein
LIPTTKIPGLIHAFNVPQGTIQRVVAYVIDLDEFKILLRERPVEVPGHETMKEPYLPAALV